MEYLGETHGYSAHKNSEGYIELFKQKGTKRNHKEVANGSSIQRIVTVFTKIEDVIMPKKKRLVNYDPSKDEKQLKIL